MSIKARRLSLGCPKDFSGYLVNVSMRIGENGEEWKHPRDLLIDDGNISSTDAWNLAIKHLTTNRAQQQLIKDNLEYRGYENWLRDTVYCFGAVYRIQDGLVSGDLLKVDAEPFPVTGRKHGGGIRYNWGERRTVKQEA